VLGADDIMPLPQLISVTECYVTVSSEKESEKAFEKLQLDIMSNVPNIELNKNFYFHDSSLCGSYHFTL